MADATTVVPLPPFGDQQTVYIFLHVDRVERRSEMQAYDQGVGLTPATQVVLRRFSTNASSVRRIDRSVVPDECGEMSTRGIDHRGLS